jgi:glucan phosphoethanolaminetransferase (alkaline phosphatase superfamily)
MSLRLFHITEFADSMLTPAAQRDARHPAFLILLASLWLALAGNVPLWRELSRLPMETGSLIWIILCFALLTTSALGLLLTLLNWPWLLKGVLTLLLWLTALNTVLLLSGHAYLNIGVTAQGLPALLTALRTPPLWQTLLLLAVLALVPSLWIWALRLRRIPALVRLPQNLLLALLCTCVLGLVWFAGSSALLPLLQDQPRWLELLSPFNTLLSLRHA